MYKKISQQFPIEFILGLGDNIYPDGVKSVKDPQFKTKFEIPYSGLKRDLFFFQTLGNHDYRGNILSQIKYTNHSERWKMPNNFYVFRKTINNASVEFFAIDTNLEEMSNSMRKKHNLGYWNLYIRAVLNGVLYLVIIHGDLLEATVIVVGY